MKKLLFSAFLLSFILLPFFLKETPNGVVATDIGDDSYIPFILTTNEMETSHVSISFDDLATSKEMECIQTSGTSSCYLIHVLKSSVSSYVTFKGDSFEVRTSTSNTVGDSSPRTYSYIINGSSIGASLTNSYANVNRCLASSYNTRRIWFTMNGSISGYFGAFIPSLGYRYMARRFYEPINDTYMYYIDIPANQSEFSLSYLPINMNGSSNMLPKATYTNSELHKVHSINVSTKTLSEYNPSSYDEYFINEYLKGFTSCLDSDINGYKAYPYIEDITDKYVQYGDDTLESVYQDDYMLSDYDDGYNPSSIRGGYSISARDKLNALSLNYNQNKNSKIVMNIIYDNNVILPLIISIIGLSVIGSYIYLRIKIHKEE